MDMVDGNIEIDIADNGKWIEDRTHGDGHGLKNLSTRLQKLEGSCKVESRSDGGTVVKFRLPFVAIENASPGQTDELSCDVRRIPPRRA